MNGNAIRKVINALPILLIRLYRAFISPIFGPSCKYYPTCSSYALEAFMKHNILYATWLTVWRVLRCNPFSKGGYDPVPSGRTIFAGNSKDSN